MRRETMIPRIDWREKCEAVGFEFHSMDGVYWDESACYRLTAEEVDVIEAATLELHGLCLKVVERVVEERLFDHLAIPAPFADYLIASWQRAEPTLFGRFDLRFDGVRPPKLLEYNADTPTALLEASVVQWYWLTDVRPGADQFNSLHEKLIARWRDMRRHLAVQPVVYFTCVGPSLEDRCNLAYLMDTALQAGIEAREIVIGDIGWDGARSRFVDLEDRPLFMLCKLYPWEWLMRESFGAHLPHAAMRVIEPPWKAILSNKAILPLLWEMFPDHPNLLPAYYEDGKIAGPSVRKPLLSREGANITIHNDNSTTYSGDQGYGTEGYVYQAYDALPDFGGGHMVIGAWMIGDEPAGIGIREDINPITSNMSRFVPHYFE